MDHHTLAGISIAGTSLDLLGGLYLAYDLLGGEHGPLRSITRGVTYGMLFGIGFGIPLGLPAGLAAGIGIGITFGPEFARASRGLLPAPYSLVTLWSMIRGASFGVGAALLVGPQFGFWFGLLSAAGQVGAYRLGFAPTEGQRAGGRPGLSRKQLLGAAIRTVGYGLCGAISGYLGHDEQRGKQFGIVIGLTLGIVSVIVGALIPFIEWKVDRLPERRLGAFGALLVVIGFCLQSVQYWVALLDIGVH
jgi:hypothetical protein